MSERERERERERVEVSKMEWERGDAMRQRICMLPMNTI